MAIFGPDQVDQIRDRIRREIDDRTKPIYLGQAKSYEDYKHRTGIIRGLELAYTMTYPEQRAEGTKDDGAE